MSLHTGAFTASEGRSGPQYLSNQHHACRNASTTGIRAIRRAGSHAARTVAMNPIAKAVSTVAASIRMAATYPALELGGGGIGIPIAEIAAASIAYRIKIKNERLPAIGTWLDMHGG